MQSGGTCDVVCNLWLVVEDNRMGQRLSRVGYDGDFGVVPEALNPVVTLARRLHRGPPLGLVGGILLATTVTAALPAAFPLSCVVLAVRFQAAVEEYQRPAQFGLGFLGLQEHSMSWCGCAQQAKVDKKEDTMAIFWSLECFPQVFHGSRSLSSIHFR